MIVKGNGRHILVLNKVNQKSISYRWICIYPAYINNKKSRKEGRKLRKDLCVENPTYQEIKDVLSVSNLRIGIENKLYSREKSKVGIIIFLRIIILK